MHNYYASGYSVMESSEKSRSKSSFNTRSKNSNLTRQKAKTQDNPEHTGTAKTTQEEEYNIQNLHKQKLREHGIYSEIN